MSNWLLPSLSHIFHRAGQSDTAHHLPSSTAERQLQAELEWRAAVAALETLAKEQLSTTDTNVAQGSTQGLVLCGPLPVLSDPTLSQHLATWVFVSDTLSAPLGLSLQLNPFQNQSPESGLQATPITPVPILDQDPIAVEQFCLMLTPDFGVILVLGQDGEGQPQFQFSFDPKVLQMCWQALLLRVRLTNGSYATQLHRLFEIFSPHEPEHRLLSRFTTYFARQLSYSHLRSTQEAATTPKTETANSGLSNPGVASPEVTSADLASSPHHHSIATASVSPLDLNSSTPQSASGSKTPAADVELLKAIAHEVRTPLATIRTLTRLLLRRKDLAPDVLRRLGIIDNECTEQIDRFGLIFKAAELGEHPPGKPRPLATVSLSQVFQEGLPRWQSQAERRNLKLSLKQPEHMPCVVSDPPMLDQALTGLIDRFTRQLPSGSSLALQVSLAGDQLKLQFRAEDSHGKPIPAMLAEQGSPDRPHALGQLLSFQPATGSVSLNLAVTKNLFQALGGKLRVKARPQPGEIVTVFLPLQDASPS